MTDLQSNSPLTNTLYTVLLVVTISYTGVKLFKEIRENKEKRKRTIENNPHS